MYYVSLAVGARSGNHIGSSIRMVDTPSDTVVGYVLEFATSIVVYVNLNSFPVGIAAK